MSEAEKTCPRCGRSLAKHEWKTDTATGERFPVCQGEGLKKTKFVKRSRQEPSTSLKSIPLIGSVSIDQVTGLAGNWGIPTRWAEKIVRMKTILKEIGKDPLLKESLTFMGGTALNFGVFGDVSPRFSFDLDFNFRGPENQTTPLDMDDVLRTTHNYLQDLLLRLNYSPENVKYKSWFELGQYKIQYRTLSGELDNFKVEICYSRRIPLLRRKGEIRGDNLVKLKMMDNIEIKIAAVEELCGEKIAAFFKRKLSRDVFDIYNIAKAVEEGTIDFRILRKCALICIFYQEVDPREIDWDNLFEKISLDTYLRNTLTDRKRITKQQFSQMISKAKTFLKSLYSDFTDGEMQYFNKYFKDGEFHPKLMDPEQDLHAHLANQSEIQWLLSERSVLNKQRQ